jgi:hypothetical protein
MMRARAAPTGPPVEVWPAGFPAGPGGFPAAEGSTAASAFQPQAPAAPEPTVIAPTPGEPAPAMCYLHPAVPASQTCRICGLPICETCDFALPMGTVQPEGMLGLGETRQLNFHLCPRCATAPRPALGKSRRKYLVWSYVLAVWSTLGLLALLTLARTTHTKEDLDTFGAVMGNLIIWPCLIGTALGFSAIDRRLANPFSVKAPAIWNAIILGLFILLAIIGMMK